MTSKQIEEFELLEGRLTGLAGEIQALAKKTPNEALNKFKVGVANGVVGRLNALLGEKRTPIEGFRLFDTDAVPTASDVLLVLSQYAEAMEHLRAANITRKFSSWFWLIDGQISEIQTRPPKKLGE